MRHRLTLGTLCKAFACRICPRRTHSQTGVVGCFVSVSDGDGDGDEDDDEDEDDDDDDDDDDDPEGDDAD